MTEIPEVRYAGQNRFLIDDGEPVSAYYALEFLESAGATRAAAKSALRAARERGENDTP